MINETMAQRFWPGEEPLGTTFSTAGPGGPFTEVVGVVRDSRYRSLREDAIRSISAGVEARGPRSRFTAHRGGGAPPLGVDTAEGFSSV